MVTQSSPSWVLLSYQMPREPSTPRIAVWRRLKQLGVLQIGDGVVALPERPETIEQLEWVAEQVTQADGDAVVWSATPRTRAERERLVSAFRAEREAEYAALEADIGAHASPDVRTVSRWRRELQRIERRDHLGSPGADVVRAILFDQSGDTAEVMA